MIAKYDGICPRCTGVIKKGDPITYNRQTRQAFHLRAHCDVVRNALALRRNQEAWNYTMRKDTTENGESE